MRIRIKKLPQQHELNAKKWKHGLGGNLFSGEDTPTQQMDTYNGWVRDTNNHPIAFNDEGKYYDQVTGETGELQLPNVNIYPNNYRSNFDPSLGIPNLFDRIANLYQYSKGYIGNKTHGVGDGEVIDLSNQNVSRINSNTRDVTSILTNDFVEHNNNAIRKKKDFVNTTDTLLGDKKIPLSKISTFYGIEDGKLKVGPLEIFDDETVVVPNRAKYVGKVKEYYPGKPASKEYREAIEKGIIEYNNSKGYEPSWQGKIFGENPRATLLHNLVKEEDNTREGRKKARDRRTDIINSIRDKYSDLDDSVLPYVVTEDNDTIKGYKLNASPKTLFADENGNAIFVANPRQHAEEINSYLQNTPMYPVMVDNGRYAAYQTSFPNAEVYGGLNRPDDMFILGTTKAYGGNLFDGTTQPTQQMNNGLNLYRNTNKAGDVWYTYQEAPDSEEILLIPTNKRFSDDPTNWDYKDASGREYSPRMVKSPHHQEELYASGKPMGPLEKYVAELNWRAKNDPASIALQGKYTMPAIAAPLLAPLGEAFAGTTIAGVPATTWANTAMAAGFAGHGLNHWINKGIDGWGDAAMTALELAPLGRPIKAIGDISSNIITQTQSTRKGMGNPFKFAENIYNFMTREPIPFTEKQAAAQRMKSFIQSPEYLQRQKEAGLSDLEISNFQDMIMKRLNNGNFPAYRIKAKNYGLSLALPKPFGGVYIKKGIPYDDFLNSFDHEVAHYSTVNFGKADNEFLKLLNKENPNVVEKVMGVNASIVPYRPEAEAAKLRVARGHSPNTNILKYFRDDQERRSNAYAIFQEAQRRGMSVDELVDYYTMQSTGEIFDFAPEPLQYLNYAYTPDNIKKFIKNFLSVSAPTTLGIKVASQNDDK